LMQWHEAGKHHTARVAALLQGPVRAVDWRAFTIEVKEVRSSPVGVSLEAECSEGAVTVHMDAFLAAHYRHRAAPYTIRVVGGVQVVENGKIVVTATRELPMGWRLVASSDTGQWEKAVVADIFSGTGAFTIAAAALGVRDVRALDSSNLATSTYERNFPGHIMVKGAIENLWLWDKFSAQDLLIAAGPNCQPWSGAGGRARGMLDQRSDTLVLLVPLADLLQPRAVIVENVCGLAQAKEGDELAAVVRCFAAVGYECFSREVDVTEALAQVRRRVVLKFVRRDLLSMDRPWHTLTRQFTLPVVGATVESRRILDPACEGDAALQWAQRESVLHDRNFLPWASYRRILHPQAPAPTVLRSYGRSHTVQYMVESRKIHGFGVRTRDGYRFCSGREIFRLQGFPEWYSLPTRHSESWELGGNAFPPPFRDGRDGVRGGVCVRCTRRVWRHDPTHVREDGGGGIPYGHEVLPAPASFR